MPDSVSDSDFGVEAPISAEHGSFATHSILIATFCALSWDFDELPFALVISAGCV